MSSVPYSPCTTVPNFSCDTPIATVQSPTLTTTSPSRTTHPPYHQFINILPPPHPSYTAHLSPSPPPHPPTHLSPTLQTSHPLPLHLYSPADTMDDKSAVKALSDARDSGENLSARSTGALSGIRIQDPLVFQ